MNLQKIFLLIILFAAIACKKKKAKDYSCTCTIHGTPYTTVTKTVSSKTDSDATTQCNDYGKSQANGFHYECEVQ
jgi:hypothetical protein